MHILQRKAKASKPHRPTYLSDAVYDFANGVWRGRNGLVAYDPAHQLISKKCDVETGEDQKGQ